MKVSWQTVARTICLFLALANSILTATGHSVLPIEDADVETAVSTAFTVITALVAWWKNNSFTSAAIEADEVMNELKQEA